MKKLAWFLVFFTPLLVGGTADAFFDISAPIQRAVMIANQVTQISHAVTSLAALRQQFDKIKEQYDHLRDQTFGQVGQLTDSFSDLSSVPGQLVGDGLSWRQDFANTKADALVTALGRFSSDGSPLTGHWRDRLSEADTVTEQDVVAEYVDLPVELASQAATNYRRRRDSAAQRTAMNYAVNDAAAGAAATIKSALESFETIRAQTNTSPTALQQAQVAGMLTSGEVAAALAQLQAFEAAKDAAEALEAETRRRELEAERLDAQSRARQIHARRLAGIAASRDGGDELRMRVTATYGG